MTLQDYLKTSSETETGFGARIGCRPSTIHRICKGSRKPSFKLMARIQIATGGKVQPNDFLEVDDLEGAA